MKFYTTKSRIKKLFDPSQKIYIMDCLTILDGLETTFGYHGLAQSLNAYFNISQY